MKKLIAFGAIIVGLFLISKKSNAQTSPAKVNNNNQLTESNGDVVITDHDYDWDYKRLSGDWYTKKKTANTWIDMKKALSPENYKLSIAKLENFLNKKTRKITVS